MSHPSILTTKLYFPLVRESLVSRSRLVERLQNGLQGRLTLISAPPGYGKTTLMSEWRVGMGRNYLTAWLSLDDDDTDPTRFLTYVIAAIASIKPNFGENTFALLQSVPPLPTRVILANLINELGEFDKPFLLVLDDYHAITNPAIHEAVTYMLDHLPSQMHLVILTRTDPPLRLSLFRGRSQLTEIRSADLRFTVEEAAAFLNQVMGLNLTGEQVAVLEQRTEGWIAGLQLAALSMQGRDDVEHFISTFSGSHHYIIDYLVDEVLNSQPETVQDFLLRTSILDRLTAPLCDILTEHTDGRTTLAYLEHANLFLIPLDDERRWYRYHHLFRDVLRNRLRLRHPETIFELHTRAAEWFERNHFIPEAVDHALSAGDMEYGVHLVEKNALFMMSRGELTTLIGWINKVGNQITGRPWLSIYQSWVYVHTGRQEAAALLLDEVEGTVSSSVASTDSLEIRGHIAAIRAHIAAYDWDAASVIAFSKQALELLPETNLFIRSFIAEVQGAAYLLNGDLEKAKQSLSEAYRIGETTGNLHVAVLSTYMLGNLMADQGQLHKAVEFYQKALRMATTPAGQLLPIAARAFNGLSRIYYEWNDFETVNQFTEQSIELAQKWGNINALVSAHLTQARVKKAQGDLDRAQTCLNEIQRLTQDHNLAPGGAEKIEILRVELWLRSGDIDAAASWVQMRGFKADDVFPPLREAEYKTFARVLLAQKLTDEAHDLVKRLLLTAEGAGKIGSVIELLILKARILQTKNDDPQALKVIERVLALGQSEGYTRTFLDAGRQMMMLLYQAEIKGIYPLYARKLLSAANMTDKKTLSPQLLIEPLSGRELEILRLVAEGKSNRQIAETLFIAVGTVKKHLNNIFGKLGVTSRTQCVARGRKLKLL
jgi:LuxR family maltose regulon positive regulatory protein